MGGKKKGKKGKKGKAKKGITDTCDPEERAWILQAEKEALEERLFTVKE